jgi:hypothetical protein
MGRSLDRLQVEALGAVLGGTRLYVRQPSLLYRLSSVNKGISMRLRLT